MSVGLEAIPDGTYTVAWKNVSTVDGHRVRGAFVFSVGQPISGEPLAESTEEALLQSPAEPVIRWVTLVSVLAMVGGLVFELLVSRPVLLQSRRRALTSTRRWDSCLEGPLFGAYLAGYRSVPGVGVGSTVAGCKRSIIHDVTLLGSLGRTAMVDMLLETEWGRRVAVAGRVGDSIRAGPGRAVNHRPHPKATTKVLRFRITVGNWRPGCWPLGWDVASSGR